MMKFFRAESTNTSFVRLDTKKCEACWKCIAACPKQVIGKIDLPWHKHSRFENPDRCRGCLNCVKICAYGALSAKAD